MTVNNKKVHIISNGCPENRIDAALAQEYFKQNSWTVEPNMQTADVILFNTCALTKYCEDKSLQIIEKVQSTKKPKAEVIVCGCLPQINRTRLKEAHQGLAFGHDSIEQLKGKFNGGLPSMPKSANYLVPFYALPGADKKGFKDILKRVKITTLLTKLYEDGRQKKEKLINACAPNAFLIKISTGCLNQCSFCAVRLSRGRLKSKPLEKIIEEFEEGLNKGYKEFALIGTDVGSYGKDLQTDLVALLDALVKKEGDYKIRLRNVNPRYLIEMIPRLHEILKSGKISFIGSAVESGNNRILKLMNRIYKVEDFRKTIKLIKREYPWIQLRTQFMVGFPTETEQDFHDTLKLLDDLILDYVEVYVFEARQRTKAADMEGQVPVETAKRRRLRVLTKIYKNEIFRPFKGNFKNITAKALPGTN